jgi:hypothetical protein
MGLARIFDKWKGRSPRTSYKARDYFDDFNLALNFSQHSIKEVNECNGDFSPIITDSIVANAYAGYR